MKPKNLPTKHAAAERASAQEIQRQSDIFLSKPSLAKVLNAISNAVLILNKERQIVFANQAFLDLVGQPDLASVLQFRFGEAVGCLHATEEKGGCGTSAFCCECGGMNAIMVSQEGKVSVQECRISLKENAKSLDLRAMASPLTEEGQDFTVFSITDIVHEKRKEALEEVFFHDILNTASGLSGFSKLLINASPDELNEYKQIIPKLALRLVDEINGQWQLIRAENNELNVHLSEINSREMLEEIVGLYTNHKVASSRHLKIDFNAMEAVFTNDKSLLYRVIGNMVRNALEATGEGKTVTLSCEKSCEGIQFSVHNDEEMPLHVQLQIFQRSFSTKGPGRGLGTYSMKLLSEQYLGGKISFFTSAERGTTFYGHYPLVFKKRSALE